MICKKLQNNLSFYKKKTYLIFTLNLQNFAKDKCVLGLISKGDDLY